MSAETMPVALVGHEGKPFVIEDRSVPREAEPGTAIVDITLCGVCGSDLAAFRHAGPYPPYLSGHEWTGIVRAVGDGSAGVAVGDRVVAGVPPACGHCAMCLAGHHTRCERIMALPFGQDPLAPDHGALARSLQFPADYLIKVPAALSDIEAAMVEPATVALHAVRRLPPAVGDASVVLGGGPVGLFAAQLLKGAGAGAVIVVEPQSRRRQLAGDLGATASVPPGREAERAIAAASSGRGADIVYDCVGNEVALASAVELARPGAAIMMVGVSSAPISVTPLKWMMKELTFHTSLAHHHHEFAITMELMASGRLVAAPLAGPIVGLHELEKTFIELAGGADYIKVLIDPSL